MDRTDSKINTPATHDGSPTVRKFSGPRTPARTPWGYTYFMRRGDFIKIGHSCSPAGRAMDLQVGFPDKLEILATIPNTVLDEEAAHYKFRHLRVSGEWFRAEDDLMEFIAGIEPVVHRVRQQHLLKVIADHYEAAPANLQPSIGFYMRKMLRDFNTAR